MELRHALSVVGMSLSAFLTMGCNLFPRNTSQGELQTKALIERNDKMKDDAQISPIAPPPPSNYLPHPAPLPGSLTAFVEPDGKRVQFTVAPVRSKAPAEEPLSLAPAPLTVELPLVAALRCVLQKHPQEAQQLLDKHDKTDRDLLLDLMKLTAGIGEKDVAKLGAAELASTLEQLGALTAHLRQRAGLTLDHVCFCRKIDGFGQFEALPSSHLFQPGSEGQPGDRVHIYAELRNFASRLNDGQFETTLSSTLKVFDMQNREVVVLNLDSCVDRCQSRRQDYFLNVRFHVPPKLPAGVYTLRVVVEDQTLGVTGDKASRTATRSLPFRVGPAGVVTAKP